MRSRRFRSPLAGAGGSLALAALLACPGGERGAPASVQRDSAGITIVESSRAAWDNAAGWTVDTASTTAIGTADGEPPYLFSRVVGATRLPDGRVVVADGASSQLRFFDSTGVFIRAVGRAGQGPGEFEHMRRLGRCGADSLFAFDLHWQAKVFTPDGTLAREVVTREPGSTRGPYALACSPAGVFAISGWGDALTARPIGFYRSMAKVWVLDRDGRETAMLGEHVASERIGTEFGSGPHPFGRHTSLAVADSAVLLGSGERFEVRRYSRDGTLQRIQRGPPEDLSITPSMIDAYRAAQLAQVPPERRPARERALAEMPMPDGLPAFTALLTDADNHLWAQRFSPEGTTRERWGVFAPDGSFLGHVELPRGLTLLEVGRDYVLGLVKDAEGVERIQIHALHGRAP